MRELLTANLRHYGRRYTATLTATAIAVAFMTAALVLGGSLSKGVLDQIAGKYEGVAAVIEVDDPADMDKLGAAGEAVETDGRWVACYDQFRGYETAASGFSDGWVFTNLTAAGCEPDLNLVEGTSTPEGNQIVLTPPAAERLNLTVGSTLALLADDWNPDGAWAPEDSADRLQPDDRQVIRLEVVGIAEPVSGATSIEYVDGWISRAVSKQLDPSGVPQEIRMIPRSDIAAGDQDQVVTEVEQALSAAGITGMNVMTGSTKVDGEMAQVGSSQLALNLMLALFPLIAVVMALIVVATTFQVIFTQRRKELALLRVVGATGKQVRRLMVLESAAVGLVGSALGVLVGWLGGSALVTLLKILPSFSKALTTVSLLQVYIIVAVGMTFTVLAGYRPARKAVSISPIEGLAETARPLGSTSRAKLIFGWVATVATVLAALVTAYFASNPFREETDPLASEAQAFAYTLLAAIVTVGLLISALAVWLPVITSSTRKLPFGAPYQLAAANTGRNPGRTAATGISVFIGVMLIAMVTLGAQSSRVTAHRVLERNAPVDLVASAGEGGLTADQIALLGNLEGVSEMAVLPGVWGTAAWPEVGTDGQGFILDSTGAGNATYGDVSQPGVNVALMAGPPDTQSAAELCVETKCVPVTAETSVLAEQVGGVLVDAETLAALGQAPVAAQAWLKLENPETFMSVLSDLMSEEPDLQVEGQAAFRATIDQTLNMVVLVVVALLAVSALVALVGITNTLSLSVAERTRENGMLRALGMTKRSLRSMLTWEALLIGLAATLMGLAAGAFFGTVGFLVLPLGTTQKIVAVPWLQWLVIAAVALGSSLLASLMPARRAARVSPIEAIATE